ncbi:hypothetical protein L1987_39448 [Smallanthus sonchifolius]|uniref:Uncharacterized protein n=1 Tax=Smallanthus sonchifolius TaxID=185202 RepID=A0ACB9HLE6_9ASTR|nr:hypothetical protein L1987_39448 [Smallanthus sonchifolius]
MGDDRTPGDGRPPEEDRPAGHERQMEGERNDRRQERWIPVSTKRRRQKAISFFLANLPDFLSGKELWMECHNLGHIVDAFIPVKRDKSKGLGGKLLLVRGTLAKKKTFTNNFMFDEPRRREKALRPLGGNSYRDALVGINPELSIKFHEESKSVVGWKQLSLVGEVLDMGILSDLKNRLNGLVESGTDLRYIGGMKVMLTCASKFLNDRRMDHELIFKELAIWESQDVSFDRIAWVQVHEVPLQLWEGNTFDRIGQLLNKVVEFSPASNKTGNLSFNEIGILVSNPLRISTNMNLEWGGKPYPVLRPRFAQGHLNRQANLRIRAGVLGESHNSGDGDPTPDPNDMGDGGMYSSNRDQIGGNNPSEWESELGAKESRGSKGIKEGQDLPAPNFTQVDLNASPVVSVSLDQKRGPGSRNTE